MSAKDNAERTFTSPAAVLTLLRICGWGHHSDLLYRLEMSRFDGLSFLTDAWAEPPGGSAEQTGFIVDQLNAWLAKRPDGPLLPGPKSVEAITAMICGWSTGITHVLAAEPRSYEEMKGQLTALGGPDSLREHIDLMVSAGLIQPIPGDPVRYELTPWGSEVLPPLIAAAQREARLPEEDIMAPELMDVEATFALVLPTLELAPQLSGPCQLAVQLEGDDGPFLAGASTRIEEGRVVERSTLLETKPETWIRGTAKEWCDVVIDPDGSPPMLTGGDDEMTAAVLADLHERLFGAEA